MHDHQETTLEKLINEGVRLRRCMLAAREVTKLWALKPTPIPGGWLPALEELGRACDMLDEVKP